MRANLGRVAMVSQRVLCRRFVGRAAELEELAARRRSAADSRGGAIVIAGEAGIGKSRLLTEFSARFKTRASTYASAQCHPFGQAPLDPLAAILGQLEKHAHADRSPQSRDEHLAAILDVLDASAARRLTVIAIEDAHWAAAELLHVLARIAQWAAGKRLLLVVTAREGDIAPGSAAFAAFAQLERTATIVHLETLDRAEMNELMVSALSERAETLDPKTFANVARRAAGNPFFAEELLRHAVDDRHGEGARGASRLPISLQGVIRERLERCAPADRDVLSAASCFGRRFRIDVVEDLLGIDRERSVASLQRLIEHQLVDASTDPLAYDFRHALARDVVYGDLVPAAAHGLHLRIAELLEGRPDAAQHAALLAHSFWEANLRERAAPYGEAAGESAMADYAYEDALGWFERAASGYGARSADLARVLGRASIACNRMAQHERAVPLYERAIAACARAGDYVTAARFGTFLVGTFYNSGRERDAHDALATAFEHAARSGERAALQRVRIRAFAMAIDALDLDEAQSLYEAIDEGALVSGAIETFEYFAMRSRWHALRGELAERARVIDLALASSGTLPEYNVRFLNEFVAKDSFAVGDFAEARRHARAGLAVARQIHSDEACMHSIAGHIEESAGDYRAARASLERINEAPEFITRMVSAAARSRIALALGDDDALAAAIDADLLAEAERGGASSLVKLLLAYAPALERLGRRDEALDHARRALELLHDTFDIAPEIVTLVETFPRHASTLRAKVAPDGREPAVPLQAAVFSLLCAIDEADASRALEAARRFSDIGWPKAEAIAWEYAGDVPRALAIYRRLGCAPAVQRLERSAVQAGAHAGVLSPRERELAQLVAAGRNNREAAEHLSITVKAVEKYLTSIYAKLGVKSRTQLTAYLVAERTASR